MTDTRATLKRFAAQIADVLAEDKKELSFEAKQRQVLELLQDALAAIGKVFLVGGLPAHVNQETGKIMRLLAGTPDIDRFLDDCGFLPAAGNWDKILARKLQSRQDIPPNFVHSIAHFDTESNVLYLNEWGGTFLRITSSGECSRHRVGEFDVLMDVGDEPHPPLDLDALNFKIRTGGPALSWNEDSALVRYIFGIGSFSETSGIGRANCITVLLIFALAILFQERVLTIPVCHLRGLSGSKKTSLCVALGWLLSGAGMKFSPTACPETVGDVENALINAKGLLVLDEANSLRPLTNLIKSVVTGGELKRRVLYTTAAQATFPIDCALMLPANFDSATDESLVARCLQINMGDPGSSEDGWRGEFHVRQEWVRQGIRQQCWEELVLRCASAMWLLTAASTKGEDDLRVPHRMSGFWSFAYAIARQESAETETQVQGVLESITSEQRRSVSNFDDVLPLLQKWLTTFPEHKGKRFSASEVGSHLLNLTEANHGNGHHVTQPIQLSKAVRDILQSSFRMTNKLSGTAEYWRVLGMEIHNGRNSKLFSFNPPPSVESEQRVQP